MSEKPIIFSTESVQAILENKKSQTRRVIKPRPPQELSPMFSDTVIRRAPYKPGDVLWVRETWHKTSAYYQRSCKDDYNVPCAACGNCEDRGIKYFYKADGETIQVYNLKGTFDEIGKADGLKWKPSIHMPRDAARIFLRVTDVRVERLQDISESDCVKEGIPCNPCHSHHPLKTQFAVLWETLNAKRGYGWNENPFVWVCEFNLLEAVQAECDRRNGVRGKNDE